MRTRSGHKQKPAIPAPRNGATPAETQAWAGAHLDRKQDIDEQVIQNLGEDLNRIPDNVGRFMSGEEPEKRHGDNMVALKDGRHAANFTAWGQETVGVVATSSAAVVAAGAAGQGGVSIGAFATVIFTLGGPGNGTSGGSLGRSQIVKDIVVVCPLLARDAAVPLTLTLLRPANNSPMAFPEAVLGTNLAFPIERFLRTPGQNSRDDRTPMCLAVNDRHPFQYAITNMDANAIVVQTYGEV